MSIKPISFLRSAALAGVAVAALAIAPAAMAIDQGFAPRPDFPGAKQTETQAGHAKSAKTMRSTSKSTSKMHAQRNHGKHHAS
jgi:hypothetical protein